jgi:hypothetical protein
VHIGDGIFTFLWEKMKYKEEILDDYIIRFWISLPPHFCEEPGLAINTRDPLETGNEVLALKLFPIRDTAK